MSTLEIKEKLIREINQVEDVRLLRVLYHILTTGKHEEVYQLNDSQIAAIEEARDQYRKGEFFTNEEVDREIEEWLKK